MNAMEQTSNNYNSDLSMVIKENVRPSFVKDGTKSGTLLTKVKEAIERTNRYRTVKSMSFSKKT